MANRKDNGQFAPGVSGNPGGRPKLPAETAFFLAGLVIALLIIDTPGIHAATDSDRCVVQRYLTETHLAKPEVQAELDSLTPSQRQKVLVEMTRMIHQHSLDRVYLVERQRVRRGAPDVCGVGREGDPR